MIDGLGDAAGAETGTARMAASYPRIPYGEADIRRIRLRGWLYVDKTRFLRRLEEESYAFLIRPRRFGKSLWVSVLENYYDRTRADEWDAVFKGTDIGREPTDDRSRYVILRFNFSAFDDTLETLRERFESYCGMVIRNALERNADLFPDEAVRRILAPAAVDGRLGELFRYAGNHGIPLYGLIDEYDNFANTVLAHRGREAYESFTHGGGFYRNFFATLKAGAGESGGGLERLFITGVSPITMDDVTSGFNIGANVSLDPKFHDLLGFTEAEVRDLLTLYRERGAFDQEVDAALAVMREWYDGYRFARRGRDDLYNPDMVLYYLKHCVPNEPPPDDLIDANVRIDYGKLRHLLVVNRDAGVRFNGNFDLLRSIAGEGGAEADVNLSFPLEELVEPENFLSLLYYFGLLSIRGASEGATRLGIPNQTVRRLLYGYLRDGYRDVGVFSVSHYAFSNLMRRMAYRGAWRPALEFLAEAVAAQTGIRDYLDGEKVVQAFLAAHFSLAGHFLIRSERELNKGYADLHLEPFLTRYPDVRYGYVIELKYLRRGEAADGDAVASRLREARAQLRGYLADEGLRRLRPAVRHVGVALVFHGWELAACKAVGDEDTGG